MKKIMALILLMNATSVLADCLPLYREKVRNLDNRMTGFKTAIVTNVVAEGALIGGMLIVTGTVAAGGILTIPAATVGAGTYLGALALQKSRYEKAIKIIRQAQKGKGRDLTKFIVKFERANGKILLRDEIAELIVEANAENAFCAEDDITEKVKLMKPKKMMKLIEENV